MANLNQIHEFGVPDLLNAFKGGEVTLLLSSGASLTGTLKADVNYASSLAKTAQLSRLEGRDYFSAAVPIKEINCVIFRSPEAPV